ncbi:MAG: hypothetical protein EAZ44_02925 [Cytophagia bacterium]|nr:MAG: hypothetical protein EAZ44_02925 [Cytophagia bacterium]TAG46411.1 MAG: hypothetical protein EAZ31_00415 [Cytophagia bacterium]
MAQDYDKIFKENIEEVILPLIDKLLGIRPEKLEEIPDDLQKTIERRPDFLKIVRHKKDKSKDYILHIEFQTDDEPLMVYRMLEYYALLLRKYKLPILQYVFFIGKGQAKMVKNISHQCLKFQFNLINLEDFDYELFLKSSKPEEIILAILGNFNGEKPEVVVKKVLNSINSLSINTLHKQKCVIQLEVLSNLRDLQQEIINQINNMALVYNLQKDLRYIQGRKEGLEQNEQRLALAEQMAQEAKQKEQEAKQKEQEAKQKEQEAKQKEQEAEKNLELSIQFMLSNQILAADIAKNLHISLEYVRNIERKTKK